MNISKLARKELNNMRAYVPGARIPETMEKYGLNRVVKLASNENPLGPSPKAVEAIINAATGVSMYPDSRCTAAREAIAQKQGVDPDQIIIGNGGEEIIRFICESFINKGEEFIISYLGFGLHTKSAQMMGGKCVSIPMIGDYDYDLEAFLSAVTEKTKIMFITNPNNPTGKIIPKAQMESFLERVPEDVLVLVDEAYFEFAKQNPDYPDCTQYLNQYQNLIVLRTLSKVVGLAGMRIGYAITSKEIAAEMSKLKGTFNVNTLALTAGIAAVADETHIERTIAENNKSFDMMRSYFDKKGLRYLPTSANFLFVDMQMPSTELFETLMQNGVILRPGFQWGEENFMRISSGTVEETEFLLNVLDRVLP